MSPKTLHDGLPVCGECNTRKDCIRDNFCFRRENHKRAEDSVRKRRLGPASPPTSMQGTPPFQNEVVAPTVEVVERARLLPGAVREPVTNHVIQAQASPATVSGTVCAYIRQGIHIALDREDVAIVEAARLLHAGKRFRFIFTSRGNLPYTVRVEEEQ